MKKFYREPPREIPIKDGFDVLVTGAGPAGFSAAVNSARTGAKTLLIEQSGVVGGMSTAGLLSNWTGKTRGGFYEEILERSAEKADRSLINAEKLKTVIIDMLTQAGAELQLYTLACDVAMESGRILGIITESKSGRELITAQVFVDASGDGDIAARAGVPYTKGRESDNKMQPATLMFQVGGVDNTRAKFIGGFEASYMTASGDIQSLAKKELPFPAGHVLVLPSAFPGVVTCNMTNTIDIDGTTAEGLTEADLKCRSQIESIIDFLRRYAEGFENCYLINTASLVGIRETRHFHGEYTLTGKDITDAKVFPDRVVTKAHFDFDVHNISGSGLDKTALQKGFPQPEGYTIPYRCLLPQKVENLLLSGRNISGTHLAHSNFRAMPICANTGQAAGIAAALAVEEGISPRNLDIKKLQKHLKCAGVDI